MGQLRDARIQTWQKRAGIEPASGARVETLGRMSQLAFQLIEVIALERSGIRDGDGQWSGCYPIGSIVHQLTRIEHDDLTAWKAANTQHTTNTTIVDDAATAL